MPNKPKSKMSQKNTGIKNTGRKEMSQNNENEKDSSMPRGEKAPLPLLESALLERMAITLKLLALDMIEAAASGHPGSPMGMSELAIILAHQVCATPHDSEWINRDRLIFSGGHNSALLYGYLHLMGYDISMEDLKAFRQLGSKTPGHPEYGLTHGVEISTGPLGQGIGNAVGMAMGAKRLGVLLAEASRGLGGGYGNSTLESKYHLNAAPHPKSPSKLDHKVFCICGDGDIEEGVGYEAMSLAGSLGLDNLIIIYDSNNITIDGTLDIAFSEDVGARARAQGFVTIECDGHDFGSINTAINDARRLGKERRAPVLIISKSIIAHGALDLEGSNKAHGAPLGAKRVAAIKKAYGRDKDASFIVDSDVRAAFSALSERHDLACKEFYADLNKGEKALLALLKEGVGSVEFSDFDKGDKVATRSSNGALLNALATSSPFILGGSADLAGSNNTLIKDASPFPLGPNIFYGIREHAMGAVSNGIATYASSPSHAGGGEASKMSDGKASEASSKITSKISGDRAGRRGGFLPYAATFFVFSDYMSGAMRVAAIMRAQVFYIFTHDSIGVGEDGTTHQPIEQLSHLRALPELLTLRPMDANENIACMRLALSRKQPSAFILSRQKLEVINATSSINLEHGYNIVHGRGHDAIDITLLASGSEVALALEVARELELGGYSKEGRSIRQVRVISIPCYELFFTLPRDAARAIIGAPYESTYAIEAARGFEWYKYAGEVIGMEGFGVSGRGDALFAHFGFNKQGVIDRICRG